MGHGDAKQEVGEGKPFNHLSLSLRRWTIGAPVRSGDPYGLTCIRGGTNWGIVVTRKKTVGAYDKLPGKGQEYAQ